METVRVGVDATVTPEATLLVSLPSPASASLSPLWWFSLCRLRERASQYDLPQPSARQAKGFVVLMRNQNCFPVL